MRVQTRAGRQGDPHKHVRPATPSITQEGALDNEICAGTHRLKRLVRKRLVDASAIDLDNVRLRVASPIFIAPGRRERGATVKIALTAISSTVI
jgi:hypothetical protein